jgi:Carboxypeptidase regulatory-like domain
VCVPALVLFALLAGAPQQETPPHPSSPPAQPPRDARVREQKGTAIIRGRVVAADTGLPIRQANVETYAMSLRNQMAAGRIEGRSTRTDDQGNFQFEELPAGSYRLTASTSQFSAQYLAFSYGAKGHPMDPGTPIVLSDGETFDKATIALPRGSVIAGRVTDDGGEPLARVRASALWFPPGSARGQRLGSDTQTDDLGQFRLFSLAPGEYAIVAEAPMMTFVDPNMLHTDKDDEPNGFLTRFYPGTPDAASAQRVRTRAGGEASGIEIRMSRGRLFRVSGIVMDSQGSPIARADVQLARRTAALGMSGEGFTTDGQGRFQMQNLASGTYRLIVLQRQLLFGPNGPEGDPGEMASMPITIAAADLANLVVVTAPGATVLGRVEFEPAPPEGPVKEMRVLAMPADPDFPMGGPARTALVESDLTFRLQDLGGEQLIRDGGGLPPNAYVKAVLLDGNDISDTPREFKSQDRVTIVVSSRGAALEGTVTDAEGAPTSDAYVFVFPEDKARWRANGTRVYRSVPDANGHYRIAAIHPGRYFIVAAPLERFNIPGIDDISLYEELSNDATMLVVNEDETRTVDLRVQGSSGG